MLFSRGSARLLSDVPPPPPAPKPGFRFFPSSWQGRVSVLALAWALTMTTASILSASWQGVPPKNRPIKVTADDYVSSDTCRACHPGNYASWHASFHRTMTQVANPENFAPVMAGLELSYDNVDYRVVEKDHAYYVQSKPTGSAASSFGKPEQIVLLTGSHNLQVYWTETGDAHEGRTLGQFPFAYIVAEKKWTPMVQSFLVPPGPKRVYSKGDWNNGCINCHVTQGRSRFVEGSTYDSQVSEFGIACEACHSGGAEHIAQNRSPLRRFTLHLTGAQDKTIANPARMDGPTSSLVCGQCHSIWAFNNPAASVTWNKQHGKYRPGDKDLDLRWVVQPVGTDHPAERAELNQNDPHFMGDRFWDDGMIRVTGRELNGVTASPCYKGGKFSCLSCHEMHPAKTDPATLEQWRTTDQMAPKMESNEACLQCHKTMKANLAAHTHHAADSPGSSCYNCHMPHTTYGLLRSIRSHQISNPMVQPSSPTGRPNACNLCHLDQSLAWTADKLHEWYGQKVPELPADDRQFSAGVQWLLKGDAGQRMLIVWSMGWTPAQKAAGRDWLYPYVIFELNDPYAAVRFGAWKALQTLPGFSGYEFDYSSDDAQQKEALALAYQKWWKEVRNPNGGFRPETVLDSSGLFRQDVFERMLDQRSNKKIYLAE
ncbi:MAG: c-type cytochrome precursor [Verrucomicrobia bacterium]|nr:c-type cytochrome precursor [Verrucomicrobiota bacterium]